MTPQITNLASFLGDPAHWVDLALLGALALCGFYMIRVNRAIRTLRTAQDETPQQIQNLIAQLDTVRESVSKTLADVSGTMAEVAVKMAQADELKEDVKALADRLTRHLARAQETVDEVRLVSASAERIADRITEVTGLAKHLLAPKAENGVVANEEDEEVAETDSSAEETAEESAKDDVPSGEATASATAEAADVRPAGDGAMVALAAGKSPRLVYSSNGGSRP